MARPRMGGLCALVASLCALAYGGGAVGFLCGRGLSGVAAPVPRDVARPAAKKSAAASVYKSNEEIMCTEVRLIGELNGETDEIEEMNEVLATSDAMRRARSKGLDLVLINEDKDPPLVKIVVLSKYVYQEKKAAKVRAQNSKVPRVKEVKLSYTVGEHDLNTKLTQMEGWLSSPRQQVKVIVQMKGRTKMFEKQARNLLTRVQEEIAAHGRIAGGGKAGEGVKKDGRGDLVMMLNAGPDVALLKEISTRAGAEALEEDEKEEEEDEEEEETSSEKEAVEVPQEIADLQAEIEETKQDLLDCGIKPGQIGQQPEMQGLYKELEEVKERLGFQTAASAFGRRAAPRSATSSVFAGSSLALAAGVLVVAASARRWQLRPRF